MMDAKSIQKAYEVVLGYSDYKGGQERIRDLGIVMVRTDIVKALIHNIIHSNPIIAQAYLSNTEPIYRVVLGAIAMSFQAGILHGKQELQAEGENMRLEDN